MPASIRNDGVVFAGLMPHAPILVEGVGQAHHRRESAATIHAMTVVARRAVAALPDTILVISPHSPRQPGAVGIWRTPLLQGSFAEFGAAENRVVLPLDGEFAERLADEARARGVATWAIDHGALDHGATVPLSFLAAAGWRSPTVVIGLPGDAAGLSEALGRAIGATSEALGRRLAVIASGDMSHRLTPDAPCGYHRDGARFDQAFIGLLRAGGTAEIPSLDDRMVNNAAEDVVESTRIALAATGDGEPHPAVLSYEGPFGVGYGVAVLVERPPSAGVALEGVRTLSHRADLPRVARAAVVARLGGGSADPPFEATGALGERRGVFVTLRTAAGLLRGCEGTAWPVHRDVVEETWQAARLAAFHDPRFPALRAEELAGVRFTVTLLGPLEPVASVADLDPARFGIFIRTRDGRRSLLLPAIKGIDTVAGQLEAARHKGGIGPDETVEIRRFATVAFGEPPPGGEGG